MKVNLINLYKDKFKSYLSRQSDYDQVYKYENVSIYRKHWDLGAMDLKTMYDKSFTSQLSGRLWGGSVDSAKSMMLLFFDTNKEFVRAMFRDLYNESKELSGRVDRFTFHCDQMLEELSKTTDKYDKHFHEGAKMPFLYLCFSDPAKYPLYDYNLFRNTLPLFETKSVPEHFEIDRQYKLCKAIYTIISKDENLVQLHQSLIPEDYGVEANMLLLDDFLRFCLQESFN